MRVAVPVVILDADRKTLERWSRGRSFASRLTMRAKIVLMAARGMLNQEIAAELGLQQKTVSLWRKRYVAAGLAGIEKDAPRGGRPSTAQRKIAAEIIRK